jgi:hypothetical protein
MPDAGRVWLILFKNFNAEPVRHAGYVIADGSLQTLLGNEPLEVAGHKLGILA